MGVRVRIPRCRVSWSASEASMKPRTAELTMC